jgi:hypothetical protein
MGQSSSSSSQTVTNNTVNQDYMNTLNKTIMNSAVNTMVNNASSCSSAVNQNNSCDMSGSTVSGDFNFTSNQTNDAKIDFSCIQVDSTTNEMNSAMVASMLAEMMALNGTDGAAQLNTAADSSNTSGFGSTGGSSSSSTNTNVTNNVTNETIVTVENIFEQNLTNNFTSNTVNECIGKTTQSNSTDLSNIDVNGNATVECFQSNTLEQVQECKQLSDAINTTTQQVLQELGMEMVTVDTTSSTTESIATAQSENVSTGPIQDFGNAVAGILSSVFGLASLEFLGPILGIVCSLCSCIICIILIVIVGKTIMDSSTDSDGLVSDPNGFPGANNFGFPDANNFDIHSINGGFWNFTSDSSI